MEETRIKKLPPPELNDGIIDAVPVRRKDISTIKAHKKRMYYFVAEDFEERWKKLMTYLCNVLPEEIIDRGVINGYLRPHENGYKLGIFDQG